MDDRANSPESVVLLLVVNVVQNCEVSNQGFDLGREELPTSRTSENVGSPQVQQANLAESVSTKQNARDLVFVVVLIVANWAVYIHNII